jgi:hypothetical protein
MRARNAGTGESVTKINRVLDLHRNRDLIVFAGAVTLFQLADAAMLPAIGMHVAHSKVGSPVMLMFRPHRYSTDPDRLAGAVDRLLSGANWP